MRVNSSLHTAPPPAPAQPRRRAWLGGIAGGLACAALAVLSGCAGTPGPASARPPVPEAVSDAVRHALAPTGVLRIGVYPGSPSSMVRQPGSDEWRGVTVDLGRALARRLGVEPRFVVHQRVAEVVDALQAGQLDFTVTNASPARARVLHFTAPVLGLELGYLVMPGSPVRSIDAVDRPGVRVGVSQGSSSLAALGDRFRYAVLRPAASLAVASDWLRSGEVDAFATNKGILHEVADGLPGARVLDGRWGIERLAIAVPKGRDAGLPWLARFAAEVQADGSVQRAAQRAGLRGTIDPGQGGVP